MAQGDAWVSLDEDEIDAPRPGASSAARGWRAVLPHSAEQSLDDLEA
jgi:hypothetical protein